MPVALSNVTSRPAKAIAGASGSVSYPVALQKGLVSLFFTAWQSGRILSYEQLNGADTIEPWEGLLDLLQIADDRYHPCARFSVSSTRYEF